MRPAENIGKLIKKLHTAASAELDKKVYSEISKALAEDKKSAAVAPSVWRIIMKSKLTKLAAAAVVIVAVLIGVNRFGGSIDVASVALGNVLERIEQSQAFTYRMKMTMTGVMMPGTPSGKRVMDGTVVISNSYGMKMEMTMTDANTGQEEMTQQMYVLPDQKVMFMVMPEQKKYTRMEFDDDLLARMKKQNNDPREMVKQIMNCRYTELGRSVIDGVEVEGFRTTDASFSGGVIEDVNVTLWVDVEQWLPVRTEMDFKMNEQMEMSGVVYDYQWNVQVGASEFEPVIPADYTLMAEVKMPGLDEESAIQGLRTFAEIADGNYPASMNMMDVLGKVAEVLGKEAGSCRGRDLEADPNSEVNKQKREEMMPEFMQKTVTVQAACMFYAQLVKEDKDPAYYGDSVLPGDADRVLMRWKISDDQYRVIFGDLTAETVSAQQLAELEKQPGE